MLRNVIKLLGAVTSKPNFVFASDGTSLMYRVLQDVNPKRNGSSIKIRIVDLTKIYLIFLYQYYV